MKISIVFRGGFITLLLGLVLAVQFPAASAQVGDISAAQNTPTNNTEQHIQYLPIILTPTSNIARIEITPQSILMTEKGATRSLSAQAFDHKDKPITANLSWSSSHPELVSVSNDGMITALSDLGSAQVIAEAEGVASTPSFVIVAAPAADAFTIQDNQVVEGPELLDPNEIPTLGTQYRIVLSGAHVLLPGSIVLASESLPIAGRVVATSPQGDNTAVVLEIVPLTELFRNLSIDERFDLRYAEVILDESLGPDVQVSRNAAGNLVLAFDRAAMEVVRETEESTEFNIGPFRCEASLSPSISGNLIEMELIREIDFDFVVDINDGSLDRLLMKLDGSVKTRMSGGIFLTASFEGSFKCRATVFTIPIPIFGAISAVISPVVPLGMGFDLDAQIQLAQLEIGLVGETGTRLEFGFDYKDGAFTGFKEMEVIREVTPIYKMPNLIEDFRFTGSTYFYGFAELGIGVFPGVPLRLIGLDTTLSIIEATFGPRFDVDLAPKITQVLNDDYASTYDLKLQGKGSLGSDLSELFELIGDSVKIFELSETIDIILAESPTDDFGTDRLNVIPNQEIKFTLDLEPANLNFPVVGYNIATVSISRFRNNVLEPMVDLPVAEGQEQFSWNWMPGESDVGENTFFAFVETNGIPDVPLEIATIKLGSPIRISAGDSHTCAITERGTFCWGVNWTAQLGTTSATDICILFSNELPECSRSPIAVQGDHQFSSVSAGGEHTCAIDKQGQAYCWGWDGFYQIGGPTTDLCVGPYQPTLSAPVNPCTYTPTLVEDALGQPMHFSQIEAGGAHTCGIASDGFTYCWGKNDSRQSGIVASPATCDFGLACNPDPVKIGSFEVISAGPAHSCALDDQGYAYCWGSDKYGQLGDGTAFIGYCGSSPDQYPCSPIPVPVAGGHRFKSIDLGFSHTCAITLEGDAYCWGRNWKGNVGDGSTSHGRVYLTPNLVVGGHKFTEITSTCGITTAGSALCWGWDEYGQLGNGGDSYVEPDFSSTPVLVTNSVSFRDIDTGGNQRCATDGVDVFCWGSNSFGQTGTASGGFCYDDSDWPCNFVPAFVPIPGGSP